MQICKIYNIYTLAKGTWSNSVAESSGRRRRRRRGRIGLLPGRSTRVRGSDWERGRVWTFDRETYAKARPPKKYGNMQKNIQKNM